MVDPRQYVLLPPSCMNDSHDSHAQAELDKAAELLDMVVAGVEPSYDAVRDRLAAAYTEAGLRDVANFITCA